MGWLRSPYGAWLIMRWVWFALLATIPFAIVMFFQTGNGWWFAPFFIAVLSVGSGSNGMAFGTGPDPRDVRISLACDVWANWLSSQYCPACGQSCFDHSPPSGYAPDNAQYRFWPVSSCANCGCDLTQNSTGKARK